METIKNYLETMFRSLPGTAEVRRAKSELLSMMEDKYNELISEGKTDNEAVGIVISEFGNLDELAESLGIKEVKEEYAAEDCHLVTTDEAADFLFAKKRHAVLLSGGVGLIIFSLVASVIPDLLGGFDGLAVVMMFMFIIAGVLLIIYANMGLKRWNYLKETTCKLDVLAREMVVKEKEKASGLFAAKLIAGIILCVISWFPCVIVEDFAYSVEMLENIACMALFVIVAIGVFFIVEASNENGAYGILLSLKGVKKKKQYSGEYSAETSKEDKADEREVPDYKNPSINVAMHVFWPVVTCAYLIWSFVSGEWWITWIIWPIATAIFGALKSAFKSEEK